MRKVQLYLTEGQYRLLKERAGQKGSIAQAVRELIDASEAVEPATDPLYQRIFGEKEGSGGTYRAEEAKRELYRRPT